jgi:hypothetical protein
MEGGSHQQMQQIVIQKDKKDESSTSARVKQSQDINDESSNKSRRIIKGSMEGTGTDYKESKEGPGDKVSRPTKIQSTFQ